MSETLLLEKEFAARLASLRASGWSQGAEFAAAAFSQWSKTKVKRAVRAHWDELVDDPDELDLRESFDDGLDYLQLMEVVVQTGYLPLPAVESEARAQFTRLLGRAETHEYLLHYDYLLTRYLAARIGFRLVLPEVVPPPVESHSALRCARLIATSTEWKADENIELFTQLLDDYSEYSIGAWEFRQYLSGNYKPRSQSQKQRLTQLSAGFSRMLHLLAALFEVVDEAEARRHLGAFFLYWIRRLYGYREDEKTDADWLQEARMVAPEQEVALLEQVAAAFGVKRN